MLSTVEGVGEEVEEVAAKDELGGNDFPTWILDFNDVKLFLELLMDIWMTDGIELHGRDAKGGPVKVSRGGESQRDGELMVSVWILSD